MYIRTSYFIFTVVESVPRAPTHNTIIITLIKLPPLPLSSLRTFQLVHLYM